MEKENTAKENPHEHHRKRMKARFLQDGLDTFEDHEALEMLLYYSIPRNDTNEIAHALLKEFGSLSAVFDADIDALTEVPGIGYESALLIRFVTEMCRRYEVDSRKKQPRVPDKKAAEEYCRPYFMGDNREMFIALLLDATFHVRKVCVIEHGDKESVFVNVSRIVKEVVNNHQPYVLLAHSHPNGFPYPSSEDRSITMMLADKLMAVNAMLCDHLIFSRSDVYFLSDERIPGRENIFKFSDNNTASPDIT